MKVKIRIYFTLYGNDFNSDYITGKLNTSPTITWIKGEHRSPLLLYDDNGWSISTVETESLDLAGEIEKLLEVIYPKKKILLKIIKDFKLSAEISCEIHCTDSESPSIYLDSNLIQKLSELNCAFDLDLYY